MTAACLLFIRQKKPADILIDPIRSLILLKTDLCAGIN